MTKKEKGVNATKDTVNKEEKEHSSKIEDALREIKNKFGDESIMKLGEAPKVDVGVVPTGSIGLDAALGVGGHAQAERLHARKPFVLDVGGALDQARLGPLGQRHLDEAV